MRLARAIARMRANRAIGNEAVANDVGYGDVGVVCAGIASVNLIGGFAQIGAALVELPPLQLRILAFLIAHAGRRVTREELRRAVFRVSQGRKCKSVPRHISLLRAKLGSARALIRTVPGGYSFG